MSDSPRETPIFFDIPLVGSFSANDLLARWTKLTERSLYQLVMQGKLHAYLCKKNSARQGPNGEEIHDCVDEGAPHIIHNIVHEICWDFVRFDFLTIKLFERQWWSQVFKTREELHEKERLEANHSIFQYDNDEQIINVDEFEEYAPIFLVDDDVEKTNFDIFTKLQKNLKPFPIYDEANCGYGIPAIEIEEFLYQVRSHRLITGEIFTGHTETMTNNHQQEKVCCNSILIPKELVLGKTPAAAIQNLRKLGTDEPIIAYILFNLRIEHITKAALGALLLTGSLQEKDDGKYRKHVREMLKQAENYHITLSQ